MQDLYQIYQQSLDEGEFCPVCQAAMYWIEAEYQFQVIEFYYCSHCDHHVFYDGHVPTCHCQVCLQQRKKELKTSRIEEHLAKKQQVIHHEQMDSTLLDDLTILEKLFLLALLNQHVNDDKYHTEYIDFNLASCQYIAPSSQLFKIIKQKLIKQESFIPITLEDKVIQPDCYYLNIHLQNIQEPSLVNIQQQLQAWFLKNLSQGVPYKNYEEVYHGLNTLFIHEIIHYCQYLCNNWNIKFYAHKKMIEECNNLLKSLALNQIFFLCHKGLHFLYTTQLLEHHNKDFCNTNLLCKTLQQYQQQHIQKKWEVFNQPRPPELGYSPMSILYFQHFLQLNSDQIMLQPLWKSWHLILPRLRFFNHQHCIQCGSRHLHIDHDDNQNVTVLCLDCHRMNHYFI